MNNQVSAPAGEEKNVESKVTELSEDMEVVSPGNMLRDARQRLSLSQEHIASKLNFKLSLVKAIEEDLFDPKMPVTFNRGYLVNYAKLVSIAAEDVLASYEALDAASIQRSEMLSFSKETSKQAEHSRVMWISYLIIAVFIGLTVLWWTQQSHQQTEVIKNNVSPSTANALIQSSQKVESLSTLERKNNLALTVNKANDLVTTTQVNTNSDQQNADLVNSQNSEKLSVEDPLPLTQPSESENQQPVITVNPLSKAVFTFKGDCWVNIYDAKNKRIAWGVKKAGYVMTVEGQAPFLVTVGKPELTSIVFNDKAIDMSGYNNGNIAKFELPIVMQ
jgi:cytoskeleton protein RodZ